jgi:putative membrane protein
MSKLYDGVSELKDGTKKFLKEISKLKGEVHDIVSDMIDELKGKGMLRSFVSEKNTEIESVQFVIKTDAISVNDAPQEEETVQETLTFWQKLLRLFGMY